MDDVYVYLEPLPDGIKEMIAPCLGGYTIYLDPRQSFESMRDSYKHALSHIEHNDFEKEDVQEIETKAHMRMESK
jgi:hypothetical protein